MKKILCFILTVTFVLSLFGAVICVIEDIRSVGWQKTTLTVTFIGLPDGIVFGTYTDATGQKHENEPVPCGSVYNRSKDVEQYYGQEYTILCGPEKEDILVYDSLIRSNIICIGLTLLSAALFWFLFLRKNSHKNRRCI